MRRESLPPVSFSSPAPGNDGVSASSPSVARAVEAMLKQPGRRWTVSALARVAGMSRAAFARHFVQEVGAPPHGHLRAIRLQRAQVLLQTTGRGLADIAQEVGYASEFSFSKAFKRVFGVAPSLVRRALPNGSFRAAA